VFQEPCIEGRLALHFFVTVYFLALSCCGLRTVACHTILPQTQGLLMVAGLSGCFINIRFECSSDQSEQPGNCYQ